jgi:hypothetical protein
MDDDENLRENASDFRFRYSKIIEKFAPIKGRLSPPTKKIRFIDNGEIEIRRAQHNIILTHCFCCKAIEKYKDDRA